MGANRNGITFSILGRAQEETQGDRPVQAEAISSRAVVLCRAGSIFVKGEAGSRNSKPRSDGHGEQHGESIFHATSRFSGVLFWAMITNPFIESGLWKSDY